MRKLFAFASAAVAATSLFAAPEVSDVTLTQDAGRTVTITYKLKNEPGIVTVDIQTNRGDGVYASIGGQYLTYFAGDANKVVQPSATETRTITWKPRKAWPDNKVTENVKAVLSAWSLDAPPDYMAVSLLAPQTVNYYTCAENVPFGVSNNLYKSEWILMRKIPAANVQWRMGSPSTELGRSTDGRENPRLVTIKDDYYIGVYEFTSRQYELLYEGKASSPSKFKGDFRPVEQISYASIRGVPSADKPSNNCNWPTTGTFVYPGRVLGKLRSLSGLNGIDLPTEAQWEFACRAGCGTALYNGKNLDSTGNATNLNDLACYGYSGGGDANGTADVGSYKPNAWGLYDMLGNVYELCLDWYSVTPPTGDAATTGPTTGANRVYRGGCYNGAANSNRAAYRAGYTPDEGYLTIGFRLVCNLGL